MRIVRTRYGAKLVESDALLSKVLAAPGPTHEIFDVLAACVATLAPGPRFAMLGFAGGGVVAPLRALGFGFPVLAVDLSLAGERLFRELSSGWCGAVRLDHADAAAWLAGRPARALDVVLEDLSVDRPGGVTKPRRSLDRLPPLIRSRLGRRGVAVTNVLPVEGTTWPALLAAIARPWSEARVIRLADHQNRIVVAGGAGLPDARRLGRALRGALSRIGSRMERAVAVATLAGRGEAQA